MLKHLIRTILKAFLFVLDKVFLITRKRVKSVYPYDKRTKTIALPREVEKEIQSLAQDGNKVKAVKLVTRLTGAGLRVSKDYVESLAQRKRRHRKVK